MRLKKLLPIAILSAMITAAFPLSASAASAVATGVSEPSRWPIILLVIAVIVIAALALIPALKKRK